MLGGGVRVVIQVPKCDAFQDVHGGQIVSRLVASFSFSMALCERELCLLTVFVLFSNDYIVD